MKETILRPYQLDSIESLRENIREREAGAELMEPRRGRRATPLPTASVRAVGYRLFIEGQIGAMSKRQTAAVSKQHVYAHGQGMLPWEGIINETRAADRISTWRNPDAIIKGAVNSYRRDYWQDQPERVEVWSEKGTIRGTLSPILRKYGVTFRVMHGYGSATAIYGMAQDTLADDRPMTVLYVGDWDPSGMHMSEVDLPGRLERYGGVADIQRIALDESDTCAGLPSFDVDTKVGDSRYSWFVSRYGRTCWELDALSPLHLRRRVEAAIRSRLDMDLWARAIDVEAVEIKSMADFMAAWKSNFRLAQKYPKGGA